ncbi:uncharacterized protein BJ171DRAFT_576432 [Polychytrium aggregatum]|uniref:uncharacterized protein n=1 Tax=Polychytrium aggregatum TaxID=110093 RepID=UPI0022FEED4C|nr:uncharacterized protein BJ171DRAFT_576432 [Polychytrium aggregatum]KAI9209640.1 hypothetical protein BJ171DRAFT_576432 [Polychytrium aggregatum]
MPTYQVLRCYEDSCRMFQVHQVKKVNKWQCRVCGEKQSTIKVFLTSPQASECRTFVQNMNMARGRAEEDLLNQRQSREEDQAAVPQRQECRLPTRSKWEDYVDEEPDDETGEHDDQGGSSLPQQPWQGATSKWSTFADDDDE